MRAYLYYKNRKVISFDLCMYLTGFCVSEARVIQDSLLPFAIRYGLEHGQSADILIQEWLRYRMLPDYRPDLDTVMCEAYGLKQRNVGRMHGTQHTAAFLNGWTSKFDHFSVYPEKPENLCYVLQDRRFWTLHLVCPKQEKEKEDEEDLTIRSGLPTFWEESAGALRLQQTCYDWQTVSYRKHAEWMHSIGMQVACSGNQFTINFSFLKYVQETVWLSDLIPFFVTGTPVKGQVLDFFVDPQMKQIVSDLLQYEYWCKEQGNQVSLTQLGVAICENDIRPVILL